MHKEPRFWAKVDKSADCWEWTGAMNGSGYGRYGKVAAHRVAYALAIGPIPDGLEIDHLCGNTGCVNPDHLDPCTHAENQRRSWARRKKWSLMRSDDEDMTTELLTTRAVADRFNVDVSTVARWVVNGHLSPAMRTPGLRGMYLFTADEVDRFARDRAA